MQTVAPFASGADPFAEFADPAGDYELSVWVRFAVNDYTDGIAEQRIVAGRCVLDCGREGGRWRPRATETFADIPEEDSDYGVRLLDLSGQDASPDPLTLLRALLSGGTA
jgi:hypothetical protein